jgi:PAS domain S-box-containing protein
MSPPSRSFDQRLEQTVELAMQIASGNLEARLPASEEGDAIDAVITVLNMLAEELQHERRSRRRAEELLEDEIDAYEHAPALFCSVDAATLVVEKCNQTLSALLGMDKSLIVGRSVLELYAPEHREAATRELRGVPRGSSLTGQDVSLRSVAGRSIIVSPSTQAVLGADGRERLRIIWRDVTAERDLEAQLLQAQKLEAIGRLSGGLAHDFNNILSVIIGASDLASEALAAHQIECDELALIQDAVARGTSLINDLLAFSKRQVVKPAPSGGAEHAGEHARRSRSPQCLDRSVATIPGAAQPRDQRPRLDGRWRALAHRGRADRDRWPGAWGQHGSRARLLCGHRGLR